MPPQRPGGALIAIGSDKTSPIRLPRAAPPPARHDKPCAQLIPLDPSPRRHLGFLQGRVDEVIFNPLPDDKLEERDTMLL